MSVSYISVLAVDVAGSLLMILFSLMCIRLTLQLRQKDPENVMWVFLLWFSFSLTVFAVSRSSGHIIKNILVYAGHMDTWLALRPYSGAVNTFAFITVSAVTFFFGQIWRIDVQVAKDREKLRQAHGQLLVLNETLEKRVARRTQALVEATNQTLEMEKKMAQAEKLASIGELSAGVAHEINNPLGVILGYTQLLLREESRDSEKYEDLKTIERQVKNCRTIVSDLLSFSRNSKTEKKYLDIHNLMDEVIGIMAKQSGGRGLEVLRQYDEAMPPVLLDGERIRQVFVNLLVNARHAAGDGGIITVTTRFLDASGAAEIRVADNGPGIPRENISRIFDPFFTTKPTGQGTGLGLSVSYGIIKNHDGEILAESVPGEETVFIVKLPVNAGAGGGV